MNILESIILGVVQGITEFLPISSSGHLVLFQKIFGINEPPIFFDTMVHGATLAAVIFYLRKDLVNILLNIKKNTKLIVFLIIGTLPAVFVGLFLKEEIEKTFDSLLLLSVGFLITAIVLFLTRFFSEKGRDMEKLNWKDSLVVGVSQAFSILPSISRSGFTISSGIFMGLDRKTALKFSFLLFIPVIAGAVILQMFDIGSVSLNEIISSVIGFFPALIFGFLSLKFLDKYMASKKFSLFASYCLFLAIISLIINFI